ncbi:hypothetical protein BUALT_Bualt01G0216400 [Buddleja alternifolia]|uniref:Cytochrome P450 n=1 Tax=Buddleja alternifolia TaxID=168488 RepID=A0AAV6Y9Z9_9LAMI|nr:hypothetical protein BUALT_Bualt01G0216400 [Buddleja alternifolia]
MKPYRKSIKLPPGPTPYPIVGNILELGNKPHQSLAKLSKIYGPLMHLKLGSLTTIVVSSPEVAKIVLQRYDQVFSSRTVPTAIQALDHHKFSVVGMPVGNQWRKLRKICKEKMFSMQKLDASQGMRREKLENLWDYVNECCVSVDFAAFGSDSSQEYKDTVCGIMAVVGKPNFADYFPLLKMADLLGISRDTTFFFKKCFEIFDEIISQRLKIRGTSEDPMLKNDMLEALLDLKQKNESELSFDDIKHLLLWKGKMTDLLYVKNLFSVDKPESKSDEDWEHENMQVCGFIRKWVEDNVYNHIMMNLRYKEGSSISDHLNDYQGILDQLSDMGVKFDDEVQALWLLNTLPDSWETFRVSLISSAENGVVSMQLAKSGTLNEEMRRRAQSSSSQSDTLKLLSKLLELRCCRTGTRAVGKTERWEGSACLYVSCLRLRNPGKSIKLPPGPTAFPIIGNILELGNKPHQSLAKLSKSYGPLMHLKLGSLTTIVVSSPEVAKIVLQRYNQVFSGRPSPGAIQALDHHKFSVAWMSVGDQWHKLRKICREKMFSMQKLDASQGLRREKLENLRDYVNECCVSGQAVDIGKAAFTTSLNLVSTTLFSVDFAAFGSDSSQEYRDTVCGIMAVVGKPNFADYFLLLKMADLQGVFRDTTFYFKKYFEIFDEIISQRLKIRGTSEDSKLKMICWKPFLISSVGSNPFDRVVVGRILSGSRFNFNAFKETMLTAFKPRKRIDFEKLDNGRFLLNFESPNDLDKVLEEGPWCYDNDLVILKLLLENDDLLSVPLWWVDFNVLAKGLLISKMTEDMAFFIGNSLGQFRFVDLARNGVSRGSTLRIRVGLDVSKPLRRVSFFRAGSNNFNISYTYERLPNFCYICGIMGHVFQFCKDPNKDVFKKSNKEFPFSHSLRAPSKMSYPYRSMRRGSDAFSPHNENPSRSSLATTWRKDSRPHDHQLPVRAQVEKSEGTETHNASHKQPISDCEMEGISGASPSTYLNSLTVGSLVPMIISPVKIVSPGDKNQRPISPSHELDHTIDALRVHPVIARSVQSPTGETQAIQVIIQSPNPPASQLRLFNEPYGDGDLISEINAPLPSPILINIPLQFSMSPARHDHKSVSSQRKKGYSKKFTPKSLKRKMHDISPIPVEVLEPVKKRSHLPIQIISDRKDTIEAWIRSCHGNFDWKLEQGLKSEELDMSEKFGLSLQKAIPLKAIPIKL